MFGLIALVLLVVWLGFQAVRGPVTSGQFPTAPTATAYARAFQATVSAADTTEPRATLPPTPQPTVAPTAAPTRAPTAVSAPAAASAATPQVATTVPAPALVRPPTTPAVATTSAAMPAPTQAPTTTSAGASAVIATPWPTAAPDVEAALSDAYTQYWQVRSDAFLSLDTTPLSQVAAGPDLARLQKYIEDEQAAGRATQVKIQHTFAVSWAHDGRAQIVDRYADMSIWVDATTHEPLPGQTEPTVDNAPVHKVVDDLQLIDGVWKVTDSVEVVDGETTP